MMMAQAMNLVTGHNLFRLNVPVIHSIGSVQCARLSAVSFHFGSYLLKIHIVHRIPFDRPLCNLRVKTESEPYVHINDCTKIGVETKRVSDRLLANARCAYPVTLVRSLNVVQKASHLCE